MKVNKAKLANQLSGLGSGSGTLEKLKIHVYPRLDRARSAKVEALFNPSEISITRSVEYQRKEIASRNFAGAMYAVQKMQSIEPATLQLDLFFDTYESRDDDWLPQLAPVGFGLASGASDVTDHVEELEKLALPDRNTHQPPICKLTWGGFRIFEGVLSNLQVRYTMFLEDGTPVRATCSCTFLEFRTQAHSRAKELYSADVAKTRVVKRGETLTSIAAEQYEDPTQWRLIAKANGIVNPRDLRPGTVLMIPKLQP